MRGEGRLTGEAARRPERARRRPAPGGGGRAARRVASILLAALPIAGCESVAATGHASARVVLEAEGEGPVEVVLSQEFALSRGLEGTLRLSLFGADTLTTPLPFDATRDLATSELLFVEASTLGEAVEGFRLQILLDGEAVFTDIGLLEPGVPFRFVYAHGQIYTSDVLVF